MTAGKTITIRKLNDQYRKYWKAFPNSHVVMTEGILRLSVEEQREIAKKVQSFDQFEHPDDPYGEHDYGAFDCRSHKVIWKIDYYNPTLKDGADDPSDVFTTARVLTIMLAEEY